MMASPKENNKKRLPASSNIVMLVAATFFLFMITLFFLYFNNSEYLIKFQQLTNISQTGSKKMQLFSEFAELSRGRTRNTLQILETEDAFEQDELNQTLEGFASKFADARTQMDLLPFTKEDKELYDSAFKLVPTILPAQREAVELLMFGDNRERARSLIFDVVLPGQQKLIDIFSELLRREQRYIDDNALEVNEAVLTINKNNNWLFTFIIIATGFLLVLVILRILRVQRQLKRAYENLEEKVDERTEDLLIARDEALKASKAKSEFLSSMSHELRTPLNAILGFAQILEMDEQDESKRDSVQEIYKAGKHLLSLINEVLDLSKIEAGKMTLSMEEVDLSNVLDDVSMLTNPVAQHHGISVSYSSDFTGMVRADYLRLKQILINLISNAIKYNSKQGIVEINCEVVSENKLRIFIKDTGEGIPESLQEGLFEPFNHLGAEGGEIEGTGIGLMITRQLVEMMGGDIGFDSVVGEGTTFWVELELLSVIESEQFDSKATIEQSDKVIANDQVTILYIEDNPANMKFMEHIFDRKDEYHLLTALTPSVGLDLAIGHLPDLILLDIDLPEMDGYELLSILKGNKVTAKIPVIAVTANAMSGNIAKGKASDFYDYVTKPIDISVLMAAIESALKTT